MKWKILMFLGLWMVMVISVNAIDMPRRTFDTLSNNSYSTTRSDYKFIGGQMNGSSVGFPAFDNTSLFYSQSSGAVTISRGEYHINITGLDALGEKGVLTSGLLAPVLGIGDCIDIQYNYVVGVGSKEQQVGYTNQSGVAKCTGAKGELCMSSNFGKALHVGLGTEDLLLGICGSCNVTIKTTWNVTLMYNNSNGVGFVNNASNSAERTDFVPYTQANFTVYASEDGGVNDNSGISVNYFAIYSCASGAPMNGTPSGNQSPILIINTPSNNSQSHNATPFINFSIGTFAPNLNFTFELYIGKIGLSANTKINRSENFTSANFTLSYWTLNNVTEGSLNGTYNLTINITDNASNNVIQFIVFNLTNNISNYNATNVSITANVSGALPPIEAGVSLRGHCNITSKGSEFNNLTGNWTAWWINGSIVSWNITTLDASNVTSTANITYMCRVANQFWANGLGSTSLTEFVNSSTLSIGDTTSPTISGQAINDNSFTTEQRVNVTVNCTDNVAVNYVRVEWNRTGVFANDTMALLNPNQYSFSSLFAVGNYNATNFYCSDGNNNIARDQSNFTFSVTSTPPSGGGGGGGGGASPPIIIREGIPLLSFGGLTLIDFTVLTTPSKKVKIARFKNVGNVTFENAKVNIKGDAGKFIMPFVCDLNVQNCINKSISIKAGESRLLTLNGTFTKELGKGTSGAMLIQEQKENGNTHELNLIVSRPPLYNIAISPLADLIGISELVSFIIVYVATGVLIIGGIWFATL